MTDREFLRHTVATVAYRAARVGRGVRALLRRLAGAPMKGESYNRTDVAIGRVGAEQTPANPKHEFD